MLEMICRAAENGGGSSPRASLSPSEERRLNLSPLGWDERFEERLVLEPGDAPARVSAVDREQPLLIDQNGAFFVPTRRKLSVQVPPLARAAARRRLGVCGKASWGRLRRRSRVAGAANGASSQIGGGDGRSPDDRRQRRSPGAVSGHDPRRRGGTAGSAHQDRSRRTRRARGGSARRGSMFPSPPSPTSRGTGWTS